MNEKLDMNREINFNNLIYHFKCPSSSISFTKFEGSIYTYNQLKNRDKTLSQVQEDQKKIHIRIKSNNIRKTK